LAVVVWGINGQTFGWIDWFKEADGFAFRFHDRVDVAIYPQAIVIPVAVVVDGQLKFVY